MTDSDTEYPLTRASLLVQLKSDDDQEAWQQFVTIYRPIIYRMACKRGLQDADAQDLAQQVLLSISQSIGRWEKANESVRFRHWLRRVAKNSILNALTRKPWDKPIGGTEIRETFENKPEDEQRLALEIELEHRKELFFAATRILKKEVSADAWAVFQSSVIEEKTD